MTTFKCGGYLYITVDDDSSDVRVRLKHSDNHVAYHNHDVPQKVKDHITANRDLTTSQVKPSMVCICDEPDTFAGLEVGSPTT